MSARVILVVIAVICAVLALAGIPAGVDAIKLLAVAVIFTAVAVLLP